MPRKAADKPPLAEWKRHKEVILSLIAQYSWSDVIDKMEKEHNFIASYEQYDAQMRAWKVHKNLKKHEWRGAFQRLDKLESRHQRKIRMRILDTIVPEDKLRRSRRRCCQGETDVPGIVPSHVSFDVLGADDTWYICPSNEEGIETPRPTTSECAVELLSPVTALFSPGSRHDNATRATHATTSNQRSEKVTGTAIDESPDPAIQSPSKSIGRGPDFTAVNDTHDLSYDLPQDFTLDAANHVADNVTYDVLQPNTFNGEYSMDQSWISSSFSPSWMSPGIFSYSYTLNDLPFKQFQNDLIKKGVDLTGLRPKPTARRSFGTSTFAIPFLRDVESFVPDTIESKKIVPSLQPNHSLLSFHSLLPGEVSQERCENNADPTGKDAMLETNFTRLLVFSITNNFAGLGDIPIAGILKFLGRYGSIDTMFRQVLKANPRHVAKSLAENLFKAAIEAQDSGIVKQLLDTSFLEVNEIVCEVDRRKLTATERAAQLRDLKTMDLLLAARADVNKSFEPWPMGGGPLKRLYDGICLGETVPDVTNIAQALIGAGAKVHADMLRDVIQRKRHSDLAFCLLQKLLPTHETDLISNSMLSLITQRLDEEQVYKSTEQILEVCESRHERQCFRKFESQVESALVHSASRGFLQVVQMLLPYAKSLYHPLIASLRGGKREVIEAILAKNSEFNPPAHENDIDRSGNFSKTINLHSEMTTPLAEAIRMKADDLIHLCEKKGALDHLDLEGHFNAALAAAATTGNLPYIYKLFQYRPLPPPSEMSTALLYSIQSGHDDISFELIAAGASFFTENPSEHDPLFAAILQRNAPVVRAILDADSSYIPLSSYDVAGKRRTVIDEAIRWGDRSIILDLHLAFPSARINHPDILEEAIGAEKDDLITFLIDLDLVDIFCLTRSLVGPIKKGDTAMVNRLIELGAEPSDSRNLSLAAEYQPRILKVLLEYIPRPVRKPLAGIGTEAVKTTIRLGLAGLEPLEDLLSSKVVDFESFGMEDFRNFEICNQGPESPLGLAIRQAVDCMGEFPIVRRLIKAGCNPNSVVSMERSSNITALLAAIKTKRIDLVKLLIDEGAEVNTKTTRRLTRTPLQLAAELGCLEIVKLLLEKGAEVDALPVQRGGGTALQLAAISGNCNIAVELLNHDAKVWASPSSWQGRWPIEGAAEHGRLDMIALLLKVMDYDSEKFERAMKLAQDNGHLGCRDLIQDHVNQCELMSQYPTTTSERQIESAGLF